jgi:hypothetical protein
MNVDRPGASPMQGVGLPEAPTGPQLTPEEDAKLQAAVEQRDKCHNALLAAAFAYSKAQEVCTALAAQLQARLQEELNKPKLSLVQTPPANDAPVGPPNAG